MNESGNCRFPVSVDSLKKLTNEMMFNKSHKPLEDFTVETTVIAGEER